MAITREQFIKLRKRGASVEDIQRFADSRKTKKRGMIQNFGIGVAKTGLKDMRSFLKLVLPQAAEKALDIDKVPEEWMTPRGGAQKAGATIAGIAEYFIPATGALKAGRALRGTKRVSELGKFGQRASQLGAQSLVEGVGGLGVGTVQEGELNKQAWREGATSLVAPGALALGGKVFRLLGGGKVANRFKNAIGKSLKPTMKFGTKVEKYYDDAVRAFKTIDEDKLLGTKALFKEADGITPRNPETVSETFEALSAAKKRVFKSYDDIAKESGEMGATLGTKLTDLQKNLRAVIKDKGWSKKAKTYMRTQINDLNDLKNVSPVKIQDRIKELNKRINWSRGGIGKIKNNIDASIVVKLRGALDELIESTTGKAGAGYQALRNQYGALKTIEHDLTRETLKQARKNTKGFFDVTDVFTGADIASGILTGNPATLAKGAAGRGFKEWLKFLNDPDRHIKEAFKIIEKLKIPKGAMEKLNLETLPKYFTGGASRLIPKRAKKYLKGKGETPTTKNLTTEAKKYKTAEEFVDAFHRGKVGLKYHITDNPNFKISTKIEPSDVPAGMGTKKVLSKTEFEKQLQADVKIFRERRLKSEEEIQKFLDVQRKQYTGEGGLMTTQNLDAWLEKGVLLGDRKYVAIIDTSTVPAKNIIDSTRGFGNEQLITLPSKARVVDVVTIEEALKLQKANQEILEQTIKGKSQLIDIFNKAKPTVIKKKVKKKAQKSVDDSLLKSILKDQRGEMSLAKFEGLENLTLKTVEKLKGRTAVNKQFISDLTNAPDIKQIERQIIRETLAKMPEGKVNVKEFADSIALDERVLQLNTKIHNVETQGNNWIGVGGEDAVLPQKIRGQIEDYGEKIYESNVETPFASEKHFPGDTKNYFAHTRYEDLPDKRYIAGQYQAMNDTKDVRRILEVQSDLLQEGAKILEREMVHAKNILNNPTYKASNEAAFKNPDSRRLIVEEAQRRLDELQNLKNTYMKTWFNRIIKEEIRDAAVAGKTKLQFPTGETAMKVEGLGEFDEGASWVLNNNQRLSFIDRGSNYTKPKVGQEISRIGTIGDNWVITDVLEDGKFKAMPEGAMQQAVEDAGIATDNMSAQELWEEFDGAIKNINLEFIEQFDISGKINTEDAVYKFYEKQIRNSLKKERPDMKLITDAQGVTWWEIPIIETDATQAITAHSLAPLLVPGTAAGVSATVIKRKQKRKRAK